MRMKDIPIYDHTTTGPESFRSKVLRRIKKHVGSYALVDPDIAFESMSDNSSRESLDGELAEFREAERTLGRVE